MALSTKFNTNHSSCISLLRTLRCIHSKTSLRFLRTLALNFKSQAMSRRSLCNGEPKRPRRRPTSQLDSFQRLIIPAHKPTLVRVRHVFHANRRRLVFFAQFSAPSMKVCPSNGACFVGVVAPFIFSPLLRSRDT